MDAVIDDFKQRVSEVEGYLNMLKAMDRADAVIYSPSKGSYRSIAIEDDWRMVAKATAYLLIYNTVESAIRSAFGHLYDVIANEQRNLEQVSSDIREIWILAEHRRLARETASPEKYRESAARMVLAVLQREVVRLDSRKLPVSGNLDADTIRDVCHSHGVAVKAHPAARGGADLVNVKAQRNALAHGNRSFSEVGREVTIDDLRRTARQAEVFVRSILTNISKYLAKGSYRAPQASEGAL